MSFGKETVWNYQTQYQAPEQPAYERVDVEAIHNKKEYMFDYTSQNPKGGTLKRKVEQRPEGPEGT